MASFTKRSEAEFMDRCLYRGPYNMFVHHSWDVDAKNGKKDIQMDLCKSLYQHVAGRTITRADLRRLKTSISKQLQTKNGSKFLQCAIDRTHDSSTFPTETDCWNNNDEWICSRGFSIRDIYHGQSYDDLVAWDKEKRSS